MTKTIRLTDIQLVLLSTAAARDSGSLLPPPETSGEGPSRIRKTVEQLIRRGLAVETDIPTGGDAWRTEGDRTIGVIITNEGRAAINVDVQESADERQTGSSLEQSIVVLAPVSGSIPRAEPPPAPTKSPQVLTLLRRCQGATLDELVAATGWLPHTTRAALTGLRKKGHAIVRGKRGDITCYTLAAEMAV